MNILFSRRACSPLDPRTGELTTMQARRAGSPAKRKLLCALAAFVTALLMRASIAFATASPEEISRSFEKSFQQKTDPRWMIFAVAVAAGVMIVLALLNIRNQRGATPKALNHQGKLVREIRRHVAIKSSELKQLKLMTEQVQTPDGKPLLSPITLLLCPSLLVKSVPAKGGGRINRRVLGGLVRKLQGPVAKGK